MNRQARKPALRAGSSLCAIPKSWRLSKKPGAIWIWHRALARACTSLSAFSCAILGGPVLKAADAKPEPGLIVTFTTAGRTDITTTPNVWLYVESGKPPTPFLPGGKFTTVWEGALNAELRGNFFFQAELNGSFKLEINGTNALDVTSAGGASPLSKSIRLNKGPNVLKGTFTSPDKGDAFVRLAWTEKGTNTSPIPLTAFTHSAKSGLEQTAQLRLGRELFLEHRCIKCHAHQAGDTDGGVPELKMDAPTFEGIGARRHYEWMARWILDPKAIRLTAHMPKLLSGEKAKEDAEAMAAYLASLKTGGEASFPTPLITKQNVPKEGEEQPPVTEAKPLYERLHCAGCHNPPDATEIDPKKISQQDLVQKFPRGKLAEFLRAPEAHYAWTRMPNFRLNPQEANELENYLFGTAQKSKEATATADASIVERGRKLVQTSGCLNCHALKLDNEFAAPKLADIAKWDQGCLAADVKPGSKAPNFSFTAVERDALQAFGKSDRASLNRHVPAEFAERQNRILNCTACHGQIDLIPPLELLGGKLKPEWTARFIAGEIPHKIRYDQHPKGEPWVEARMPLFKVRAEWLAVGLAEEHGFPPKTPAEPPIDMELAKAGQKLIGKEGGFSCVSCHGVGPLLAMEVFESEGINFAYAADRLQEPYYRRWFRNPLSIDPQTKMPVYFDEEGKSPLTDVLEGDGDKQIRAVWEYLRLRDKMPAPNTGAQ